MTPQALSAQEAFDFIAGRLRDGTGPTKFGEGADSYYGHFLVPRDHPAQEIECMANGIVELVPELSERFGGHGAMLYQIDWFVHSDDVCWTGVTLNECGENELEGVAEQYGLVYTPPPTSA